ncbi:hypothetical protein Angca_000847, partial [Angiostrongylus cantonensis]
GISVTAYMDIQKTSNDQPYFRMLSCQIDGGIVNAKVANMGLITDLVNMRFRVSRGLIFIHSVFDCPIFRNFLKEIKEYRSMTLNNDELFQLIAYYFTAFFLNILTNVIFQPVVTSGVSGVAVRSKRATDDYYDDVEGGRKTQAQTLSPAEADDPVANDNLESEKFLDEGNTPQKFLLSSSQERLRHIWIDLTLLDASATHNDFTVGMSGTVSNSRRNDVSPYRVPFPFRLPQSSQRRMVEVMISDYVINSVLYHAHRTNSLLFHVNSRTPGLGSLLKTTCSADEVCLSDHVEEVGETYPNKTMQLIIRTTSPPFVTIQNDVVKLTLDGRCVFLLEDTQRQIGVIPFSAEVYAQLRTVGALLRAKTWITKLTFNKGIQFFGLASKDLDSFRKSTQKALEKLVNSALRNGISLSASQLRFPLRLSAVHVSILPGSVFVQANVDLYSSFYNRVNYS